MHEKFESPEWGIEKEAIVDALRERGLDEETKEMMGRWYDGRARAAEAAGTDARYSLILEQWEILLEAGLTVEARSVLEDALLWAEGEQNQEEYDRIWGLLHPGE